MSSGKLSNPDVLDQFVIHAISLREWGGGGVITICIVGPISLQATTLFQLIRESSSLTAILLPNGDIDSRGNTGFPGTRR